MTQPSDPQRAVRQSGRHRTIGEQRPHTVGNSQASGRLVPLTQRPRSGPGISPADADFLDTGDELPGVEKFQ